MTLSRILATFIALIGSCGVLFAPPVFRAPTFRPMPVIRPVRPYVPPPAYRPPPAPVRITPQVPAPIRPVIPTRPAPIAPFVPHPYYNPMAFWLPVWLATTHRNTPLLLQPDKEQETKSDTTRWMNIYIFAMGNGFYDSFTGEFNPIFQ